MGSVATLLGHGRWVCEERMEVGSVCLFDAENHYERIIFTSLWDGVGFAADEACDQHLYRVYPVSCVQYAMCLLLLPIELCVCVCLSVYTYASLPLPPFFLSYLPTPTPFRVCLCSLCSEEVVLILEGK